MIRQIFLIILAVTFSLPIFAENPKINQIKLPKGFKITIYADNVPNAREMALAENGVIFVGTRSEGKVYAVLPNKVHNKARKIITIAEDLFMPNGVAYRDGSLYVAEVNRVLRYDNILQQLNKPPKPVIVNDSFPSNTHHGWKFIAFGPDGWLYVPVGAPCNVCLRKDPRFATIMRMKPDGSDLQIFAKGVRNSVGFAWHPTTHKLWFTDNGRDWLGDDLPPDELNYAPHKGMHFGYPFYYGQNKPDPLYGKMFPPRLFTPAAKDLGPHVAALGMLFYTGNMFPKKYQNQIFIAEHGSWNRSQKIGYRITEVTLKGEKATSYKVFADSWEKDNHVTGRPVALLQLPDGSMLVSDDYAGVIYRISYQT